MGDTHKTFDGRIALTAFYKRHHLIGETGTLPDYGKGKLFPFPLLMKQECHIFTNLPDSINHGQQNRQNTTGTSI